MLRRSSVTWVHIVCNISYIVKSTVSYKDHQQTKGKQNNGSLEKKLKYANCITVIIILKLHSL